MRAALSGRSARRFAVMLGALVLLGAVAAAGTWATTSDQSASPAEAPRIAAGEGSAETTQRAGGTQILRATDSGDVLEVIEEPQSAAGGPVAADPAPENLGFWAGDINPTWYRSVGGMDLAGDSAEDAVATGRRTLYVAGYVTAITRDLSLVKYVDGIEAWTRIYDGPAHGSDQALAVAARGAAIYTAGRRQSKAGDSDLLLIRWASNGDRVWTRVYDSGDRKFDGATDVAVDGDGNVTVAGTSVSTAGGSDWVVISYKPDGTRRWVARYDGPAHKSDDVREMVVDSAGNVYVAGLSASATNGDDALVAKYSPSGRRLWVRRYNGEGNWMDAAYALRARPGGGIYAAGTTYRSATGYDGLLLAYNAAGTRLFAVAEHGGQSTVATESQAFLDLQVLPGGDILCGGYDARYADGFGYDRFKVQYSPTGAPSLKTWDFSPGANNEWITALARDGQGGIYVTGTLATSSTTSQIYTQRFCVNGTSWRSKWPAAPVGRDEPGAIAVYGVNAYVVGTHYFSADNYDQALFGYVY